MIYLDNAATSWPKPESVYETLGSFLREAGANPGRSGHKMAVAAASAVASTREKIAKLINAEESERVVFTANATDSLNLAINGLLKPGDHVITSTMEHNSIIRPIKALESHGISFTAVRATPDGYISPAEIKKAIQPNTRLIALTHASNVTGAIVPAAEIAEVARAANVLFLLDGAQTVGALPIDVQALGIDLIGFPGHKGLLGPTGTGALYIGPRVDLEQFTPLRSGGTGIFSEADEQPMILPYRYEAGTVNTSGIAALGKGVEYVQNRGVEAIWAHEMTLISKLVSGLEAIDGVRVFPVPAATGRAAVVSFIIDGWTPADAGAVLDESFDIACRVGLHCAPLTIDTIGAMPRGTIRFSPGPFTTATEIEQATTAVSELASSPLA
ncbi:aminotransferase class V-fold PLP-dependent enzyme [soil metagenome]